MKSNQADLMAKINDTGDFNDDIAGQMRTAIESFKKTGSW
jgi:F-type H+-transporting ATPase subunit alpha